MTRTPDDIVRAEVLCCMSSLVSTLASGYGMHRLQFLDLGELCDRAGDLASPIDDWEESAIQAGWSEGSDRFPFARNRTADERETAEANGDNSPCEYADSWQAACDFDNLEPYQREVFEHWAITDWLADALIAEGEKVDKNFGGLCIWARTTTGQMISMDGILQRVADAAEARYQAAVANIGQEG